MANKTKWKVGQSGNPAGRPPKSRALTEILAAAGNEKCSDGNGGEITRKLLVGRMLWQLATAGQVTLYATNRDWGANKTWEIKSREWFEIVRWLFAQIDGELLVEYRDESEDPDEGTPTDESNTPILDLPDNGRETKEEESPDEE